VSRVDDEGGPKQEEWVPRQSRDDPGTAQMGDGRWELYPLKEGKFPQHTVTLTQGDLGVSVRPSGTLDGLDMSL
jgi:hypothetical protein